MGYRATLHSSLEDSPAFLTYGVDLRPALEHNWLYLPRIDEHDRLRNLSLTRFAIMARTQARAEQLSDIRGRGRRQIAIGDLVLLRANRSEIPKLLIREGSRKIRPNWTLPHRIVRISSDGQSATARSLITFGLRSIPLKDVHICDLRFISKPHDEAQRKEWEKIISRERLPDITDPRKRRQLLDKFWTYLDTMAEDSSMLPSIPWKRQRTDVSATGESDIEGGSATSSRI